MPGERDPLDVAARALRHRDRSAHEIDERLARAGVEDAVRAEALETLQRVGYVDDERFASARAADLARRGFGDAAIRAQLESHGVGADAVEAALATLEPEAARAAAIAAGAGRTAKTARRLAARGFGDDAVEAAVGADVAAGGPEFV